MKPLTCEMCGSTNLIKKDGVFVCQSCGTQYSVEEAKNMMVEGTVDVKGTVKVDTSDELKNLFEIARRAKDSGNFENAAKYYDMILAKDPQSWEANFYVYYGKLMTCKSEELEECCISLNKCLNLVIQLVCDNIASQEEQKSIIIEIEKRLTESKSDVVKRAVKLINVANQNFYNASGEFDKVLYQFGDCIESGFGEKYSEVAVRIWKFAIDDETNTLSCNKYARVWATTEEKIKKRINDYSEKIRKYDSSYQSQLKSAQGCYIATAVYGSYDCPQVWTLRRYRDYSLAKTWYGRSFIRTYYATSPTLVKWFGNTELFQSLGRKMLDKKVKRLNEQGFEDTCYEDRKW